MALTDLLPSRRGQRAMGRTGSGGSLWGSDWPHMTSLQHEMNRLFDDFLDEFSTGLLREGAGMPIFAPRINLSETPNEIHVVSELPGLEEKDISVMMEEAENALIITGEKKQEDVEEGETYRRCEVCYGNFRRVIPLPCKVDADKIDASFKKGVLKVKLPKIAGEAGEHVKKIAIKAE